MKRKRDVIVVRIQDGRPLPVQVRTVRGENLKKVNKNKEREIQTLNTIIKSTKIKLN